MVDARANDVYLEGRKVLRVSRRHWGWKARDCALWDRLFRGTRVGRHGRSAHRRRRRRVRWRHGRIWSGGSFGVRRVPTRRRGNVCGLLARSFRHHVVTQRRHGEWSDRWASTFHDYSLSVFQRRYNGAWHTHVDEGRFGVLGGYVLAAHFSSTCAFLVSWD